MIHSSVRRCSRPPLFCCWFLFWTRLQGANRVTREAQIL
jgi:hypothetical protein